MDVNNYFSKIGFKPIKHRLQYERELKKVIGEKKFKEIDEEIGERQGGASSDAQRIYRLKNQSLSSALIVSSYFDYKHFSHALDWIRRNKHLIGEQVLEIGCDIGLTACYIAMMCPTSMVTGLDMNEEGIVCARRLAERLHLNNVHFECARVQDLHSTNKYDTVIAMKTSSENLQHGDNYHYCMSLDEAAHSISLRLLNYGNIISSLIKTGGNLLFVERNSVPEFAWGSIIAMNGAGLVLDPDTAERYSYMEAASKTTDMIAFSFTRNDSVDIDSLYSLYNKSFQSQWKENQPQYSGECAALIAQNCMRSIIVGYDIYNCVFSPVHRICAFSTDDPTAIAVYTHSYNYESECEELKIFNYDISQKAEVLAEIERVAQEYRNNEFSLRKIKWKPKYEKAPSYT